MKVLLIGSGGREHALYSSILQSPRLSELHVFPGNGGFDPENILHSSLVLNNSVSVRQFVEKKGYDLVVVGPEQFLVDGIVDALVGVCPVFGPTKAAARLEGSKIFSKRFMQKYNIPTAQARSFTDFDEACSYLQDLKPPVVVKVDGLAAGKGVTVANDHSDAKKALQAALCDGAYGKAGQKVLIEDFLQGEEISVFALCDGKRAIPFLPAQDYKRAYDNDQGPNTGGMGAYLPVPIVNDALVAQIQTQILDRVIHGMQAEGHSYRGLLYAGLMVHENYAKVVEFNVRFGDPETQALLMLLENDLLPLLQQAATQDLEPRFLHFRQEAAIVVVLAALGYPSPNYKKKIPLKNIDIHAEDVKLLHAQTCREEGKLFSAGGRVLNVVATGSTVADARNKVYGFLEKLTLEDLFYRKDIGVRGR